jgi:hypothetical protein
MSTQTQLICRECLAWNRLTHTTAIRDNLIDHSESGINRTLRELRQTAMSVSAFPKMQRKREASIIVAIYNVGSGIFVAGHQ